MILAAIITSLLSVCLHLYLTLHHYQLKLGLSEGPSACNINSTFNCDAVSVSSYSQFAGIPIAIFGAWTNLVLSLLLLLALINLLTDREKVLRYAGWISALIAATSVVMAIITSALLKTYCLYCMATYVLSFASLFFIWKSTRFFGFIKLKDDLMGLFGTYRWVLFCLLAIPVGSKLTESIISQSYGLSKLEILVAESYENWKIAPENHFTLQQGLIFQGRNYSKPIMTIVEFADFLCPHCKMAYPTLHSFAESRTDVQLIFKAFPLDGSCNKDISQKGDGARCTMAAAVYCSELLDKKGWLFHHWIFNNQEKFFQTQKINSFIQDGAKEVGISFEKLQGCIQSDSTKDAIEAQAAEGGKAKIQGTPSIFVNGHLLERGQFMPTLESVYSHLKALEK